VLTFPFGDIRRFQRIKRAQGESVYKRKRIFSDSQRAETVEGVKLSDLEDYLHTAIATGEEVVEARTQDLHEALKSMSLRGVQCWALTACVSTAVKLCLMGKNLEERQQARLYQIINEAMSKSMKEDTDGKFTKDSKSPRM